MANVCELFLEREKSTLSPYAFLTANTRGREHPYEPCTMRTEFQRDRDRITHSKSFRRLMHKTQVFLSPEHDHYRTRLTHTLEVTQIARTIARSLRLNEDLAEAIALGHDLGHTPFGHAGERVLQQCFDKNFSHNAQSLRVVDKLERLNLCYEVRDGILHHAGAGKAETLEGRIVNIADRIAYINHDIDDAVRAGILRKDDIPEGLRRRLGETHSKRIDTMVRGVIEGSTDEDIRMEDALWRDTLELRGFLFKSVYYNPAAKGEESRAEAMLLTLYEYFQENPDEMPSEFRLTALEEGIPRAVADYISGMTDRYAISLYKDLFIPKVWSAE